MNYCKRCVQPDTRPGIYFNNDNVCGACLWEDEKENVDWEARLRELKEIAEWAKKTTTANYDCAIGVSGGKDSTFQALYARDKLGLRPLCVNAEPEGITDIGRKNIENLKQLGLDVIGIRPNPVIMRKLIKRDFFKYLNPAKITEYSLYASTYIIARAFKIPLIIQGENAALTLGTSNTGLGIGGNALNANKMVTTSDPWQEYIGDEVTEKDLFLFHYDGEELANQGLKGVFLNYYVKEYSMSHNAKFAVAHGFTPRPEGFDPYEIGTYVNYSQLDGTLLEVNQLLKYVKFGFGQCTDHASHDIRVGLITREEGIELVRKYDGRCGAQYIQRFCDFIGINVDEFWRTANSWRGPMWQENSEGEWALINPIWQQV